MRDKMMGAPENRVVLLVVFLALFFGFRTTVYAQASTQPLELIVLGSGGPGATGRAASSYLVLRRCCICRSIIPRKA